MIRPHSLAQSSTFYHVITDLEGKYIYVNPFFQRTFGYLDNDFIGKPSAGSYHPDDYPLCLEIVMKCFANPGQNFKVLLRKPAPNGKYFLTNWDFTTYHDESGTLKGISCVGADVTKYVETQKALDRKDRMLLKLSEQTPGVLYQYLHRKDGSFSFPYISSGTDKIYGCEPEDIIKNAQLPFERTHPDDLEMVIESINEVVQSGVNWECDFRVILPNNSIKWLRGSSSPEVLPNGDTIWHGFLADITNLKIVEKKLQESEYQYRQLFNLAPTGIILNDFETGHFLEANQSFLNIIGHQLKNIQDLSILDITPPEFHSHLPCALKGASNKNLSKKKEIELISHSNDKIPIIINSLVFDDQSGQRKVLSIVRDLSLRKKEEQQLKLLESVITNSNDSILITEAEPLNAPGPRIIYVNKAFTRITGYSPEDVIGKTPRILQGDKTDKVQLAKLKESLKSWKPCEIEVINYKKNGEEFWNHMSIVPVANAKGWYTHWIAIERDVTERKKKELEKEQLIEELVLSNKELKQFSYITSHNLRAPLTNLKGLLSLVEENEIEDEHLKEIFYGFNVSTNLLNDTVNDLLQILIIKENPSISQNKIRFVDVFESIKQQLQLKLEEINPKISYSFEKAPTIQFNKAYLESIFLNLITNSIKYRSPKRLLEIKASSHYSNDMITLVYSDNGSGLDLEKYRDRIFGLYQRFHGNSDAKGLGLYLIKSQVEALGGKVEVKGAVDKGLTFIFEFKR